MKVFNDREFGKILDNNGYRHLRTKGSHSVYGNGERTISVNKNLNRMVAQRLIKEYALVV